jgi:hypothetical protein
MYKVMVVMYMCDIPLCTSAINKGNELSEMNITLLMCSVSVHYVIQNTNHQQMHKESFIIDRNTLLHVSTLLGQLQGQLFFIVTLGLHVTVE